MRALCLAPLLWASLAYGQEAEDATPPGDAAAVGDAAPDAPLALPDDAAAPPAADDDLARLRAELEALKADVQAQKARLEEQQALLTSQGEGLASVRAKQALASEFRVDLTGYYRVRGYVFGTGRNGGGDVTGAGAEGVPGELFEGQPTTGQFLTQRLRMGVKIGWRDVASLNIHAQAFDDVVWGDNNDESRTALFAGDPSLTTLDGTEAPSSFEVFRVWTEFKIPVGVFRIGRQSSHWGLGILANDGDGFRNDFGESHYGATFDRILFATNPVAIVQAFTKKQETSTPPVILAVAYDRLVSDPLTQYYGYKCGSTPIPKEDARYDARCDRDGDGVTDGVANDFSDDTRTGDKRRRSWWADQRDDVHEVVFALAYNGERVPYYRKALEDGQLVRRQKGTFDLNVGTYVIHRWQQETASKVMIVDGFFKLGIAGFEAAFEGVGIVGDTRAIILPSTDDDPLAKKANISGYVGRVGYGQEMWKLVFETGFASGDDNVTDNLFTGRALDPDYNVGLILYEEVLKRVTEHLWAGDAEGLRSRGGVYNSRYINPRFYVYPYKNTQLIAGFLMAWPHKADGAVIRCNEGDAERYGCRAVGADIAGPLGWEVDLAVKHTFLERIAVSLEGGYAQVTNRLPLEVVGLNTTGKFFTFQARAAWMF